MNKQEVAIILGILKTEYPMSFSKMSKSDMVSKVDLWLSLFAGDDIELVKSAVGSLISKSTDHWAPVVGQIKHEMLSFTTNILDADQAWEQVIEVLSGYGSYRQLEGMASLDENVAAVVKRMGYMNLCRSENAVADRAHFMKMYDMQKKRTVNTALLPEDAKKYIEAVKNITKNTVKEIE